MLKVMICRHLIHSLQKGKSPRPLLMQMFTNSSQCNNLSVLSEKSRPRRTIDDKIQTERRSNRNKKTEISSFIEPIALKLDNKPEKEWDENNFLKKLKTNDKTTIINSFLKKPSLQALIEENNLPTKLVDKACTSFLKYCLDNEKLPIQLHLALQDLIESSGQNTDILIPHFMDHFNSIFPHIKNLHLLKKISDLKDPAKWYPEAENIEKRKIIFHSGPTNSGKTYHALQRYTNSESGVYCGPLKLLAVEVAGKTNELGTDCDLVTGEEHQQVKDLPSKHISCTIEMASVTNTYDVAVIDEIQMIRDPSRGWAWTRALLGLAAKEIHLCGEEAALDLVKKLVRKGEKVEVKRYKRLTKLVLDKKALETFDNVQPGDCIVCFNKQDIYHISIELEKRGHDCAVIYGSLPPGTKIALTKKFNDPNDPCKILVTTDAIGMGLNLSIRRVIFYSVKKPSMNDEGETVMDLIPTTQALQIGGRAGRFNTQFNEGHVTTFRQEDLPVLKKIMKAPVEPIQTAGLYPTPEKIEEFAYILPELPLSKLMDVFVNLCQMDTFSFHMCNVDNFKYLADKIQTIQDLSLRERYVFCCAPINQKMIFLTTMFTQFATKYADGDCVTFEWLKDQIKYPFSVPQSMQGLTFQESIFDVLDLYLWLSYRFPDKFPDSDFIRKIQKELDAVIHMGISDMHSLLKASNPSIKTNSIFSQKDDEKEENVFGGLIASRTGKLTQQLIDQGLLTPEIINKLKAEWEMKSKGIYRSRPSKFKK